VFQKEPATGGQRRLYSEGGRIERSRKSCQRPRSQDQNGRSPPKWGSTLAEGVGDLLAKRLQQILQGRPFAGGEEELRRHAGDGVEIAEIGERAFVEGGAHEIGAVVGV